MYKFCSFFFFFFFLPTQITSRFASTFSRQLKNCLFYFDLKSENKHKNRN